VTIANTYLQPFAIQYIIVSINFPDLFSPSQSTEFTTKYIQTYSTYFVYTSYTTQAVTVINIYMQSEIHNHKTHSRVPTLFLTKNPGLSRRRGNPENLNTTNANILSSRKHVQNAKLHQYRPYHAMHSLTRMVQLPATAAIEYVAAC